MIFVGDVHGKIKDFYDLVLTQKSKDEPLIQVGDMGVGFGQGEYWHKKFDEMMLEHSARFIRGNHDNPGTCKTLKSWIHDGIVENDMMFVGGAYSVDKLARIDGISWWPEEELSYADGSRVFDIYRIMKPEIMVTHDFPSSAAEIMFGNHPGVQRFGPIRKTATGTLLQAMFEEHQPRCWIGGHWHIPADQVIEGTRFICLPELETLHV